MANLSLPIGTIIDGKQFRYKIVGKLGQGSFGITYLCELMQGENLSNMLVCVKEFFMSDINGREGSTVTSGSENGLFSDYRKKFIREANNLARIKNENVVKVIECFEQNNTVYYSMSYIAGGSLDDYISKRGRIDEQTTRRIALSLTSALSALHSEGMVHLDLKPGNIMMLGETDPVLIDFGLAKNFNSNGEPESSTRIGGGTPGYAPMEQGYYKPGGAVPATMDVYALGATMYKMLTGQRPPDAPDLFNEGFPTDMLRRVGVSEQMISIIRKAMMPARNDRYQTMPEFRAALSDSQTITLPTSKEEETMIASSAPVPPSAAPQQAATPPFAPTQSGFRAGKKNKGFAWGTLAIGLIGGAVVLFLMLIFIGKNSPDTAQIEEDEIEVITERESESSSESTEKKESPKTENTKIEEVKTEEPSPVVTSVSGLRPGRNHLSGTFYFKGAGYGFTMTVDYDASTGTISKATYQADGYGGSSKLSNARIEGGSLIFSGKASGSDTYINVTEISSGIYEGEMTRGNNHGTCRITIN